MSVQTKMFLLMSLMFITFSSHQALSQQGADTGVTMAPPSASGVVNGMMMGGSANIISTPPGFVGGNGWNTGMGWGWNQPNWNQPTPLPMQQMQDPNMTSQQSIVPAQVPNQAGGQAQNPNTTIQSPNASVPGQGQGGRIIRDGDTIRGMARAISGSTISLEGLTLPLSGLSAPEPGNTCDDGRGNSWHCGNKAREILQGILNRGIVSCQFIAQPSQSLRCFIGRDDVGQIAALDGAAASTTTEYLAYSNEARSDLRGIWARAEPARNSRQRHTSR